MTSLGASLEHYVNALKFHQVKVWIHVQNTKKMLHGCPARVPSSSTLQASKSSSSIPIIHSPSHSLAHSPVMSTFRSISPGGLGERQQEVILQDEKHQLLAAIGSTEWDVPLLEFWAKNFCRQDSSHEVSCNQIFVRAVYGKTFLFLHPNPGFSFFKHPSALSKS